MLVICIHRLTLQKMFELFDLMCYANVEIVWLCALFPSAFRYIPDVKQISQWSPTSKDQAILLTVDLIWIINGNKELDVKGTNRKESVNHIDWSVLLIKSNCSSHEQLNSPNP